MTAFLFSRVVSRAVLFCRRFLFRLFRLFVVPRSGSGARGLIKAPAGDRGLAPVTFMFRSIYLFVLSLLPPFKGGRGGSVFVDGTSYARTSILLDLLVLTDTNGSLGLLVQGGLRGLAPHCSSCPHEGQDFICGVCNHHLLFCSCED